MNEPTLSDPFLEALQSLFDWFAAEGVPGAAIGGVAVSLLAQPRATQDIDAIIWLEEPRWASFLAAGEKFGIFPRIGDALDFVRKSRVLLLEHALSGINIDVSMGGLEFEREMIERAETLNVGAFTIKIPTPEDLVITKAVAQRPKDLADIDAIVGVTTTLDVDRIRYWVRRFADVLEMPEIAESVETALRAHPR